MAVFGSTINPGCCSQFNLNHYQVKGMGQFEL
jgi:hypothetical protein